MLKKFSPILFIGIVAGFGIIAISAFFFSHSEGEKAQPMSTSTAKPKIELISSRDGQSDATEYPLEFTATDADIVLVNDKEIAAQDGKYSQLIGLSNPSTRIKIEAKNAKYSYKRDELVFTIKRSETEDERKIRVAGIEKEKQRLKAGSEAAQKSKAEWGNSKAGKLCNENPTWDVFDCYGVADQKVWIGMTYEMLVKSWGKPSSANPSNYGNGTQWQWCYFGYSPGCFYDHDEDKKTDAYN